MPSSQDGGRRWVIGSQQIRYLRTASYPGELAIGTGVATIGRSSFTLIYGVFQNDHCVAVAASRSVHLDDSGKPAALAEEARTALSARVCHQIVRSSGPDHPAKTGN